MNPHNLPKIRSKALMSSFNGMHCTLRLASFIGKQCSPVDTVVGCHLPVFGKGVNTKVSDLFVVAGCHICHRLLDGQDELTNRAYIMEKYPFAFAERILLALCETQSMWIGEGLLIVPDGKII